MDERIGIERLLALRKLTRTIADFLRDEMRDYLTTLLCLDHPDARVIAA